MKKTDFIDWLENPVTKLVLKTLNDDRAKMIDMLLDAIPDYQSKENCLIVVGKLIGAINATNLMLDIKYDSIKPHDTEEGDDE